MTRARSTLTKVLVTAGIAGGMTVGALGVAGAATPAGGGGQPGLTLGNNGPWDLGPGISQLETNFRIFFDQLFVPGAASGGGNCYKQCSMNADGGQETCHTVCPT